MVELGSQGGWRTGRKRSGLDIYRVNTVSVCLDQSDRRKETKDMNCSYQGGEERSFLGSAHTSPASGNLRLPHVPTQKVKNPIRGLRRKKEGETIVLEGVADWAGGSSPALYSQLVWLWPLLLLVILPPSLGLRCHWTDKVSELHQDQKHSVHPKDKPLLLLTNTFSPRQ